MKINEINEEWLKSQKFTIKKGITIEGVYLKELNPIVDDRGDVTELWSSVWPEFKEGKVIDTTHVYQSATDPGVVKCWHLHATHTDQFTLTRGKLQVSLVDVREDSPTFGQANYVILSVIKPRFLKVPPGIMHGWKALGDKETLIVNFQSHPYDSNDEQKYPWDCVLKEIWGPHNG